MNLPSFKEFFYENVRGEKKSRFRNAAAFRGSNRSGEGVNNTYRTHDKGAKAEEHIQNARNGMSMPLTPEVLSHVAAHDTGLELPKRPGEVRKIGRSGAGNKQAVIRREPNGRLTLVGITPDKEKRNFIPRGR